MLYHKLIHALRRLPGITTFVILIVRSPAQRCSEQAAFLNVTETGKICMATVRLLIVDDFRLWRDCVKAHLEGHPDLQIAGFASDGLEALHKVEKLQPDLVLLDISLPKLSGIETARQIRKLNPNCKIIFLTGHLHPEIVRAALEAGACGYVHKEDASDELLASLESVLVGKKYLSHSVTDLDHIT